MAKKVKMTIELKQETIFDNYVITNFDLNHKEEIAFSMLDAYKDTVDYEGEDINDTKAEIENVINNGYGTFLIETSFMIKINNEVASVIMISLYEDIPTIIYVFTMKKYTKKKMASCLIKKSMQALYKIGYKKIQLFVSKDNNEAIRIYQKLGFIES